MVTYKYVFPCNEYNMPKYSIQQEPSEIFTWLNKNGISTYFTHTRHPEIEKFNDVISAVSYDGKNYKEIIDTDGFDINDYVDDVYEEDSDNTEPDLYTYEELMNLKRAELDEIAEEMSINPKLYKNKHDISSAILEAQ